MNCLQIIDQREVLNKDFKVYGTLEEPLFIAKDVADWIEHSNTSSMLNSVDEDEKKLIQIDTLNNSYSAWFLTEDGVYEVLMQSRKPIAKKFKKKVKEILKSIRKHGAYMTTEVIEETLSNPDFIIGLATRLKEEQQARSKAEKQIEEQKPLVSFAETCIASKDSVLVRDVAKIASKKGVNIGEKRLYKKLREWKLIMKNATEPYQTYIDRGYFEVVQGGKETSYGNILYKTTKVTPKGQVYIIEKLKAESQLYLSKVN